MKFIRIMLCATGLTVLLCPAAPAGTWTAIKTQPNFANGAGAHLLLTDGTVICQDFENNVWKKLTPDKKGSYVNGTWSSIASMPSDYGPLWYASAVLPSGNVFVMGGEYNPFEHGFTELGAYYNTSKNTWTPITAPNGWGLVGDAQCVVLPDGRLLLANLQDSEMAAFNEKTFDFTVVTNSGHLDRFDEEGWLLLPDGSILTCDSISAPAAQRYIPTNDTSGQWISAGSTPNSLEDTATEELGPMVLRYDGTVFATGATKYTAVYTPPTTLSGTGSWAAGPTFPVVSTQQTDIEDGPCCLLPTNNVLLATSPGFGNPPANFYEFDGTNLNQVANTPNGPNDTTFQMMMLMLPNGQVMLTDLSNDIEFYTPTGITSDAWRPTITSVPQTIVAGSKNNLLQGTQLNGLSQCVAYGDDEQAATNYPIVRITNKSTGHVFYCKTHNHSTMAVATGKKIVSTQFDVPAALETGPSLLQVVANGIASNPVAISTTIISPASVVKLEGASSTGTVSDIFFNDALSFDVVSSYENTVGQVASAIVTFQPPIVNYSVQSASVAYIVAAATGVTNTVFLWNSHTGQWDFFGKQVMTSAFSSGTISLTGSQYATYLSANNQVKILLRDIAPQHVTNNPPPFTLMINQVQISR